MVGFHTDDSITDSRLFLRSAALAVRAGMSRASARSMESDHGRAPRMNWSLVRIASALSRNAARTPILSFFPADPLSVYTKVLQTWVEGEMVFDHSTPQDRLYAVGG